jgi:arginyl-tRNA synthetase
MTETILSELTGLFNQAIQRAFPELEGHTAEVTQTNRDDFGHYQCNSAMKLTRQLGRSPRDIAKGIVDQLMIGDMIEKLEIAGPGFINVTLTPGYLSDRVQAILDKSHMNIVQSGSGRRVVIDFSSPNIAKEMHVGHLRSTIIGDALARTLEFLGYQVRRINHVGDWGTAFGMLIVYLKEFCPNLLKGDQETDLTELVVWYREAKKKFDDDPDFKKRSQLQVVLLQGGDPESLDAWRVICNVSRRGFEEVYERLDIHLEERGESFYNPMLQPLIRDLEERGLITVSNGAKCIFMDEFVNREGDPLPLIVQKADGGFLYATTDLAAVRHRVDEERADWLIYVTDAGQATHFEMVFRAAEKAGYLDRSRVQVDHVPFGLVLGADGKKFRTRSGDVERLVDLLDATVEHARSILEERNAGLTKEGIGRTAEILGIDAIKYADLSSHRLSDYHFSYERMLSLDGNTAAFLLYSYVRISGIKRKVGASAGRQAKIELVHQSEISLGLHLARFGEAITAVVRDLAPNRMADYLYGLAERFNIFFRDCRVEGSEAQEQRLLLCEAVERTMECGLSLLGLKPVDRM